MQGTELYRDLILFVHDTVGAISEGNRVGLSLAYNYVEHMIDDSLRCSDLLGDAINVYDPKDLYESHAANVAIFSLKMALDMNLAKEEIQNITVSALLHDVGFGKMGDAVRTYEGFIEDNKVSGDDLSSVTMHSQYGYEVLKLEGDRGAEIAESVLQHHEQADGSGYPNNLSEYQQLLSARIISITDTYEALIHPRSYRDALAPPKGIDAIVKQNGTAFSPMMVKALIGSLSIYPIGQHIQLNSGVTGKVIKTYTENPLRPDIQMQSGAVIKLIENQLLTVDKCLPGVEWQKTYEIERPKTTDRPKTTGKQKLLYAGSFEKKRKRAVIAAIVILSCLFLSLCIALVTTKKTPNLMNKEIGQTAIEEALEKQQRDNERTAWELFEGWRRNR